MRNCQFVFAPKIEYKLVAERGEANLSNLQFPTWCPRQESNPHHWFRRPVLYPLSYGGKKGPGYQNACPPKPRRLATGRRRELRVQSKKYRHYYSLAKKK